MNTRSGPLPRAVILAAGRSRRLGAPKALARVYGLSLLRRTCRLVAAVTKQPPLVIVPPRRAAYRRELRGSKVDFAVNGAAAEGVASSVRLGLRRAVRSAAILFVPVDLAQLSSRDLARLVARWQGSRRRVVARSIGPGGGVPLILPKCHFKAAAAVRGDIGLRNFVAALPAPGALRVHLASAALDVDTPQELRQARRRVQASAVCMRR